MAVVVQLLALPSKLLSIFEVMTFFFQSPLRRAPARRIWLYPKH
jgi:hypothetical protein